MDARKFIKTIRTGKLSVDEIGRGMHKSFLNARGLIEDSEVLLEKRPGRALSLAILAIEEISKVVLLANAAARAANSPVSWKVIQEDLDLRSHTHKQAIFAVYGSALLDTFASEPGSPRFYGQSVPVGLVPLLDLFKQFGFYVDVAGGRFISPDEFGCDNREWAVWLIAVAKERLASFERLHGTEERSLSVARKAAEFSALIREAKDEDQLREKIEEFLGRRR